MYICACQQHEQQQHTVSGSISCDTNKYFVIQQRVAFYDGWKANIMNLTNVL